MPTRRLSRRRTRRFWKKVFVASLVLLIATVTSVGSYFGGLRWTPAQASLSIRIWNETDSSVSNFTQSISISVPSLFNITVLPSPSANLSVNRLYYAALGITVNYLSPGKALSLNLTDIYPRFSIYEDFTNMFGSMAVVDVYLSSVPQGVGCSVLFVIYGSTPMGTFSIGSSYSEYANGAYTYSTFPTDRYYVHLMYYILGVSTILVLAAVPIAASSKRVRERYPFTTLILTSISLALYVFVGTEFDISALFNIPPPHLLVVPLLSPEIHGSYWHIAGNLPFFLIVGGISEWVAKAGVANVRRNAPRFGVFFLLPLLGYSCGYGLSGMIETMGVIFCAYAILNRKIIAESATSMGLVFVAGLTIFTFYGWLMSFVTVIVLLFSGSPNVSAVTSGLDWTLAISHIWYTVATSLAVVAAFCSYKAGISRKHKLTGKIQSGLQRAFEDQPALQRDSE